MPRIPKDNRISNQTIKLNALTIKINKTFTKTKIEIKVMKVMKDKKERNGFLWYVLFHLHNIVIV